ncbi:hypothetical protein C0581_00060 [Candidatus Parcubacteria bacterium]|nr:MAG: hypothetical protein C0581_00060 [Candidatus Parcubacteria bacterium]
MLSLIAAIAENNCIGKDNKLPWHIPEDLEHFKQLTLGNTVVMGQTTYESIIGYLGKPLPGRKNVVLTRDKDFTAPDDVRIFYSIDEAFEELKDEHVFVSGGASIYAQTIDKVDTLYITHVHQTVDGDTFFPEIDMNIWKEAEREDHKAFSFVKYIKS